jgi:hypothetical protein
MKVVLPILVILVAGFSTGWIMCGWEVYKRCWWWPIPVTIAALVLGLYLGWVVRDAVIGLINM